MRARRLAGPALGVVVTALALLAAAAQGPGGGPASEALFDAFQRRAPRTWTPDAPVRIVAIDRESLARYGQWPWPRTYFVALLDRLEGLGAATIAFDVLFADPDRTSPELVAEAARRFEPGAKPPPPLTPHAAHDAVLARRIANSPVVLGALPIDGPSERPFRPRTGFAFAGSDPSAALRAFPGVEAPLAILTENAAGFGLAGVGDGGGAARRATLFATVDGRIAPSLAVEALRVAQGARGHLLRSSHASGEGSGGAGPVPVEARIGAITAPLNPDGSIWIRYAGARPDRTLPAWRLLEGDAPDPALRAEVEGRVIVVGATAPGLRYVVDTPLATGVDGVEVHAEVLEQLVAGDWLSRPDWAFGAELLAVAAFGALTTGLVGRRGPVSGAILGAGMGAILLGGSWLAFERGGLLLSPVFPLAAIGGCYVALTAANYFGSLRQTRAVRSQFERFVAPEVIGALVEDPDMRAEARGALRPLTLLFVDARGFTTLSETMPPDALIAYLNEILGAVSDCVLRTGGTVDKFIGDCVMAFWNAPIDAPDHEDRALRALAAIGEAVGTLNAGFVARGLPPVRLGAGVNTGLCSVGLMGSPRRLDYSCIGDAVNVASRLQDLTKAFGVWNVVGEATVAKAPGWTAVELDRTPIRGRAGAERVFAVLGPASVAEDPAARALIAAVARARTARDAARAGGDRAAFEAAAAALSALSWPDVDTGRLAARYRETLEAAAAPVPATGAKL
jgi:adenylate cyclase